MGWLVCLTDDVLMTYISRECVTVPVRMSIINPHHVGGGLVGCMPLCYPIAEKQYAEFRSLDSE